MKLFDSMNSVLHMNSILSWSSPGGLPVAMAASKSVKKSRLYSRYPRGSTAGSMAVLLQQILNSVCGRDIFGNA
jgi:hypothetical protein